MSKLKIVKGEIRNIPPTVFTSEVIVANEPLTEVAFKCPCNTEGNTTPKEMAMCARIMNVNNGKHTAVIVDGKLTVDPSIGISYTIMGITRPHAHFWIIDNQVVLKKKQ